MIVLEHIIQSTVRFLLSNNYLSENKFENKIKNKHIIWLQNKKV